MNRVHSQSLKIISRWKRSQDHTLVHGHEYASSLSSLEAVPMGRCCSRARQHELPQLVPLFRRTIGHGDEVPSFLWAIDLFLRRRSCPNCSGVKKINIPFLNQLDLALASEKSSIKAYIMPIVLSASPLRIISLYSAAHCSGCASADSTKLLRAPRTL